MAVVLKHAADFIGMRLAPAKPLNDGRQTPWRGHPVFVAQHATATCYRTCLEKWHAIPRGLDLISEEKGYVVEVIGCWLASQSSRANAPIEKSISEPLQASRDPEFSFQID